MDSIPQLDLLYRDRNFISRLNTISKLVNFTKIRFHKV